MLTNQENLGMTAYRYKPGDRPIDGYSIQYALGRGGFGEVYFATSDAGREVALKVIQNHKDTELRGIGHCMNLKSAHLVMIFDVKYADDDTPWVIMEYVAGPSLREILDEMPEGMSQEQAAYFLRELARGLTDLHDAGIVHRDLKPHNVFFEAGRVKIGDYSLSKSMSVSHRSGHTMTVGSVHYMAPEISMGRYDKRVDIYALGTILHEMLTGKPPYVGESVGEVLMKHLQSEPDVSQIAEPFASVIRKAMQRDPNDRYQSTEEMARAVAAADGAAGTTDLFNPATLSMIGQQSRERIRQSASDRYSLADTFTSPQSLRETRPVRGGRQGFDVPGWLLFRTSLALVSVCCLVFIGLTVTGFENWVASDGLLISLQLVATGAAASYFYRWAMPQGPGISAGLGRRLITIVPTILLVVVSANFGKELDVEEVALVGLGCGVAQLLIDWRCFFSPTRRRLVHWLPTVLCGSIAGIVASVVGEDSNAGIIAYVVTVSLAVTLQLVSPFEPVKPTSAPTAENSLDKISARTGEDSFVLSSSVNAKELQGVIS
jgi:serine/threonine protein kinase